MFNLCYGMKVINITQLPQGNYSHPNYAMDLAGSDMGIDFWFSQGRWKCHAGEWGNGTYFFIPVDEKGKTCKVHCADGKDRVVTIALTHSNKRYIKTQVGKIYDNGVPAYEEGTKGRATGNHIHLEVALGVQSTKHYDSKLNVYRMNNELNPLEMFFVNKAFSKIAPSSLGKNKLKSCGSVVYKENKKDDVALKYVTAKGTADYYSKNYVGTYEVEAQVGVNMRDDAGTSFKVLKLLPKGTKVNCYGYYSKANNAIWLYCQARVGTVQYTGFVEKNVIKKVR